MEHGHRWTVRGDRPFVVTTPKQTGDPVGHGPWKDPLLLASCYY